MMENTKQKRGADLMIGDCVEIGGRRLVLTGSRPSPQRGLHVVIWEEGERENTRELPSNQMVKIFAKPTPQKGLK